MLNLYVYTINLEGNQMAALSFLEPHEVEQYGLPTEAVLGEIDSRQPDMTIEQFTPNDGFLNHLHQLIATHAPRLLSLQQQAEKVKNGPVYVIDYRSVNDGEKPPFEDVLGWFGVRDGVILSDTYNASPNYKLLTNAGPLALEPDLEAILLSSVREKFNFLEKLNF